MAILPSLTIPSTPKVKLFRCQPYQFHRCSEKYVSCQTFYARNISMKTSIKASLADNEPNEVKMRIGIMKEKLKEAVPNSVQEFPWRKAQHTILERLILFMQEALKWGLVLYFILSSLSDFIYTFSINRQLLIPVGLFVGCLLADFLKEISQELFPTSDSEEEDLNRCSLGFCCVFVFVNFMSTWFATQPAVFLLHVLWHWRNFMEDAKNKQEKDTASSFGV